MMVERLLNFRMSGQLIFGLGALRELPAVVARLGARQPLIVTDPGLVQAGIAAREGARALRGAVRPR